MLLPKNHENMSSVQVALEVALHELNFLHGLRVTDVPDVNTTWSIDNSEAVDIIEKALEALETFRTA